MDDRTTQSILRRLDALERGSVRLRRGKVTTASPLAVDVGGSGVPYTSCAKTTGALAVNDQVAVLVSGGDLLVIGVIT